MAKYVMTGIKKVKIEIEANNLEEAIENSYKLYDVYKIDGCDPIYVNDKLLVDENNNEIVLIDIIDQTKY